jgi:hypothetical protein
VEDIAVLNKICCQSSHYAQELLCSMDDKLYLMQRWECRVHAHPHGALHHPEHRLASCRRRLDVVEAR